MRQHQSVGKNQLPHFIREASLFELETVVIVVVNVSSLLLYNAYAYFEILLLVLI